MHYKLIKNLHNWKSIGASKEVLDIITQGVKLPLVSYPDSFILPNPTFSINQEQFLDQEICELLNCGAISECQTQPICVSPLNCVRKSNNKWRLCLDLRRVNGHIDAPKFVCEGIDIVKTLIQPQDFMISCDLKNGFLHVPVCKQHRSYLGFAYKQKFYCYNVLVFGLSCSPYYFNKTLRPVVTYLRQQGLRISLYVDDWILMSQQQFITDHKDLLLHTLSDLGLTVNYDKSVLIPTTVIEYIGFIIDSIGPNNTPWIKIPVKKLNKLKKDIRRVIKAGHVQARGLARIAGMCVAMTKAILPAKLKLRNVYRLLAKKTSWSDSLLLDKAAHSDLLWWLESLSTWNGAPISLAPPDIQIATDASGTGWGGIVLNSQVKTLIGNQSSGIWTPEISLKPSNYRELLAIIMTLESMLPDLRNRKVQILSDNISAVAYLNQMRCQSKDLHQLAQSLWALCYEANISVTAKYLAGKDNLEADYLSRISPKYEWKLHPRIFRHIDQIFGPHSIDRFASLTTTQLKCYNSRFLDPETAGVDALVQDNWAEENNFVNCPFRIIPRVLQVLQTQQAEATIIAPEWPGQHWFKKLCQMSVCPPVKLPNLPQIYIPYSQAIPEPLRNPKWRIFAWRISGKTNLN